MSKEKIIFIIAILLCKSSYSQDSVNLSFTYLPESEYLVTSETISDMEIFYEGDISKLPEHLRTRLPLKLKTKQVIEHKINTKEQKKDGSYPIVVEVQKQRNYILKDDINFTELNNNSRITEGVIILGKVLSNGSMQYEKLIGEKVNKEMEVAIKSVFDQLGNANILDGKILSINETVSKSIPMQVPFNTGKPLSFNMEMTYRLVSIDGNFANFDISHIAKLTQEMKNYSIDVTGSGEGVMVYNISNKYSPTTKSKIIMNMKIPINKGILNMISISDADDTTVYRK